jgi:CRISPR-associated protein Cmr4
MNQLIFIRTLSPLHVGTGRSAGHIDQEIARERCTDWPVVPGSSVKGVLKDAAIDRLGESNEKIMQLFGEAGDNGFAGSVCCGDLRILFFPVRSAYGGFAYITSPLAVRRFCDVASVADVDVASVMKLVDEFVEMKGVVNNVTELMMPSAQRDQSARFCFLEDLDIEVRSANLSSIAELVAETIGIDPPKFAKQICILPEAFFSYFCKTSTEVLTKVTLEYATKTAKDKGLRTEESVPCEAIFYGLVHYQRVNQVMPAQAMDELNSLNLQYLQIGGNSTTGQGLCKVGWSLCKH